MRRRGPEPWPARRSLTGELEVVDGLSAFLAGPGRGSAHAVEGKVVGLFALDVTESHLVGGGGGDDSSGERKTVVEEEEEEVWTGELS